MLRQPHGYDDEVWSVGVILYMLLTHEPCFELAPGPMAAKDLRGVYDSLRRTFNINALLTRSDISTSTKKLVSQCLQPSRRERLTLQELLDKTQFCPGSSCAKNLNTRFDREASEP